LSTTERIKVRSILARALSVEDVNDPGRTTGQAERLRTVTPHRVFLAIVSTLAGAKVEPLADVLRAFTCQVGGSLWPAVLLHFAVNAVVAVQGLAASLVEPELLAYQRSLWLSIALGLVGIGLLARVVHRPAPLDAA
jgi:hypothetical protein